MNLELALPSIVRDELLFQQTTSALKSLSRANEALDRVSEVTEKSYSHRVTEQRVRREVESRLDSWMEGRNAQIIEVPLDRVDWAEVIRRSVWRLPPFTFDSQQPDLEKGFRDALILETVADYCENEDGCDVAFVTGDRLLKEAAEERLDGLDHVALYDSIDEFASFIRLTQENLTDEFVRSIRGKARRKFFSEGDTDSVIIQEDVLGQIAEKFEEELRPGERPASTIFPLLTTSEQWERTEDRTILVGPTQFDRLEEPRWFHWETEVIWAQGYRRDVTDDLLSSFAADEEYFLVLTVVVKWTADVRSNGAFYNINIDNIAKESRAFSPLSDEERDRLGLRRSDQ